MNDWRRNLLEDEARIAELVRSSRRVAVLGIKTEAQADQAAFYVAKYLDDQGVEVIPVPVYYPEVESILGKPVHRRLADVPGPVDIVDVFRRPSDVPGHLEDILAKKPRAVWLQPGIRNDQAAEVLARAGVLVVQDRCLMVEWRRHARR
ncbi:MAG TPA: CoA-binding protein [Anaeromyxobacteraceae bacterium]